MNTYIFPYFDYENLFIDLGVVHAASLKEAFAKISQEFELSTVVENQDELDDAFSENGYYVGEVIEIGEL